MKYQVTCIAAVLLLAGCGKKDAAPQVAEPSAVQPAPAVESGAAVLAGVVGKAVEKTDNMVIPAVKAVAQPGQTITVEGKVMGAAEPFVENRAVMIIGDEATIASCDERSCDQCKTPWDACCVDSETIQAGTVTVQVVGEDGKPLPVGFKGVNGLAELSRVRVTGAVADGSSPGVLIVNADAIEIR